MVFEGGRIFKNSISDTTEFLIEGNCWALNCGLFSYLSGDIHHGSAQYLIEGVRIALTKYGYIHKYEIFRNKRYGYLLNYQLLYLGFCMRSGDYKKEFEHIDKDLLKYFPKIKKEYIKKEYSKILEEDTILMPYPIKKACCLYFIIDFLTNVNDIMSRVEVDPIGTYMFDTMKKFRDFLKESIENRINPESIVDYCLLFDIFLNKKENSKLKNYLLEYNKAKLISVWDIETYLKQGESDTVEFKEDITDNIIRTAIAFSNTKGGLILVGITDNKKVKGIKNIANSIDRITSMIVTGCKPSINPSITHQVFRNRKIIVVEINESDTVITDTDNTVFIRKNGQNRKPSPSEMKFLLEVKGI